MGESVELRGIRRRFLGASEDAVTDLSLQLAGGQTLCLVGPSGCGKSTTLRMIAGLDVPDAGTVRLGERDITHLPPDARDIAMVFQGFALYPHMRVRDIIAFPLKMRKVATGDRARRVDEVSALLGIGKLLDRRPHQLSGGERQRVAMARAIVRKPKLFLFDEPLSNLDAALRTSLRAELGRLLDDLGTTSVYVTHDQAEAMTLGDRIAVMRGGRLEQLGTPREIYERPATAFVARFFGAHGMNLVDVRVEGGTAAVGESTLRAANVSGDVTWGVRPEDLRVAPDGVAANGHTRLDATVLRVEPTGAETMLRVRVGASELSVRVVGWYEASPDGKVSLAVDASKQHWFDRATEARLDTEGQLDAKGLAT